MSGGRGTRSIHDMLRRSFAGLVAGLLAPTVLLAVLLVLLTQRYDAVIADTSRAAVVSETLESALPDEVWRVVSGRVRFAEGAQEAMLAGAEHELSGMLGRADDDAQRRTLGAALRAVGTARRYVAQLGVQMARGGAVSRNESLYREITDVSSLAATMLRRYVSEETVRLGQLNARIQTATGITLLALAVLLAVLLRQAGRSLRTVDDAIRDSLARLEGMAARIAQGDLSARVPPAGVAELYRLTGDLNDMAGQLERLLAERARQEARTRKAELRALQAQITPHFVYNTLETIVWLAEEGRNREVVDMTMAFTDFLRISLSRGQDWITVAREEQHVRSYLAIQSVRYGSIMRYEIDIDPALGTCRMLKLMLQPLVENAIYHGIKGKRGRGFLRITGRREGDRMRFTVEDDGVGMTPERLDSLRRSLRDPDSRSGYGLRNVDERLRLYWGAGLTIESEYRKGTRVGFAVPCIQEEG